MGRLRQYAFNAGVLSGLSVLTRLAGLAQGALLARLLNPAGLGALSVMTSTALGLYGVTRLGTDSTLHVAVAEGGPRREAVMGAMALVSVAMAALSAAVCLVAADWIAGDLYGDLGLAPWIRWAALYVVAHFGFQYAYFALAGFHRFREFALINGATTIVGLGVVSAGAYVWGLTGAVAGSVAMVALNAAQLTLLLRRTMREEGLKLRFARWREGLAENRAIGMPHYLSALVAIPLQYLLQGLVSQHAGAEGLGYLRVAVSLSALITFIPSSIAAATLSMLTGLRSDDTRANFEAVAALNSKLVWAVSVGLYVLVLPFAGVAVEKLFGAEYLPAVTAARIALFSAVLGAVEQTNIQTLLAQRRTRQVLGSVLLRVAVFGVAAYVMVPRMGVVGYVAAEAIGYAAAYAVAVSLEWVVRGHRMRFLSLIVLTAAVLGLQMIWPAALDRPLTSLLGVVASIVLVVAGGYGLVLTPPERMLLHGVRRRIGARLMRTLQPGRG